MGSWNETCGITQLPIHWNEPVRLFFLVGVGDAAENHAGHCNTNDVWSPRFLPVKGIYSDYGSLENIQYDWNTRWILDELQRDIAEVRLRSPGRSTTNDLDDLHRDDVNHNDLDLGDLSIETVLDAIHENSVWLPGLRHNLPLGWMMVHEWAYQHLSREMERDWRGNLGLEQVVDHGKQYYVNLLQGREEDQGRFDRSSYWDVVTWDNAFAPLGDRGHGLDGYRTFKGIKNYRELLHNWAGEGRGVDDQDVMLVIAALAEFLTFRSNMMFLRRTWSPQTGKGSQIESMELHRSIAQMVVQHCDARIAEQEAMDNDDGQGSLFD